MLMHPTSWLQLYNHWIVFQLIIPFQQIYSGLSVNKGICTTNQWHDKKLLLLLSEIKKKTNLICYSFRTTENGNNRRYHHCPDMSYLSPTWSLPCCRMWRWHNNQRSSDVTWILSWHMSCFICVMQVWRQNVLENHRAPTLGHWIITVVHPWQTNK